MNRDKNCEECGVRWPYTGRWCDRCFGNIRARYEREQRQKEARGE